MPHASAAGGTPSATAGAAAHSQSHPQETSGSQVAPVVAGPQASSKASHPAQQPGNNTGHGEGGNGTNAGPNPITLHAPPSSSSTQQQQAAQQQQQQHAQPQQQPAQSNPGPGRPSGSTNAKRKNNAAAQAAQSQSAAYNAKNFQSQQQPQQHSGISPSNPKHVASGRQQQAQSQSQASGSVSQQAQYPSQQNGADMHQQQAQNSAQQVVFQSQHSHQHPQQIGGAVGTNNATVEQQSAEAAAYAARQKQQQYMQQQQQQQQQQLKQHSQQAALAQQQHQQNNMKFQLQQQSADGGMPQHAVDQNQLRQMQQHQQQQQVQQQQQQSAAAAAAFSQHPHPHHSAAAAHQSQLYAAQQHQHQQQQQYQQQQNAAYKMIHTQIVHRIHSQFKDNSQLLQNADKSHAENLAKQIKKEELNFFLKTDDTRHNKQGLLEQKNQRMDEYILFCAENGGRVIPKQPEPVEPPRETPLIVEARIMHMDFVEESYWKRVRASQLAQECRVVALRKAHAREQRRREEAQRLQQIEEQKKREEELKSQAEAAASAANAQAQNQDANAADGENNAQNGAPGQSIDGTNNQGISGSMAGTIQNNNNNNMMIDTTPRAMEPPSDMFGGLDIGLDDHNAFDDIRDDFGVDAVGDGDHHGGLDDEPSFLGGLDDGMHHHNQTAQHAFGQEDENINMDNEEDFDPDAIINQQEERLEQQRMEEELKKQEEEKLQKIAQIEQEANQADAMSHHSEPILKTERVQTNLFDEMMMDFDQEKQEQLAALEANIMALDLTYLKPAKDLRERHLKGESELLDGDEANDIDKANQEEVKTQKSSIKSKKDYIASAKNAIKQKFDRLGQLIVDKGYNLNASEMINTEQFSQVMDSLVDAQNQDAGAKAKANSFNAERGIEGIQDKLTSLLQGDNELGLYVMPGMEDFEFDSENEAFDPDHQDNDDDEVMDMDGFFAFTDIKQGLQSTQNESKGKVRPPSVLGDEQRKLYKELKEINELAPERNDLRHMEHLCQLWTVKEQEEIQDKIYIKEYFEKNLRYDDLKEKNEHKMDPRQRQALNDNINQYKIAIKQREQHLEKYKKPAFQPKELYKERFMLTASDHPQAPQQLQPQEFSFIKWYYGLFPDQWRLIADIINYHPLTRGPLHCKEWMAREYFSRLDSNHRDLLLQRQKIQMQPWRETKLPWLINGRESCLMNSMTYLNKSHLQSIHKVKRIAQQRQRKRKQVFQFTINAQGRLSLEKVNNLEEPAAGNAIQSDAKISNDLSNTGGANQAQEKKAELAGQKRTRADIETDDDSWDQEDNSLTDDRHYTDIQIQERLLSQMLARRRKNEAEEQEASNSGRQIVRADIYLDRPFLKELMMDLVHKRRRNDENTSNNNVVVARTTPPTVQNQSNDTFTAFAYDPVNTHKDELDTNTPMWYALQHYNSCQTTIRVQHSTMFWLGYFIRRLMHEENLDKNKYFNQNKLDFWESDNEIKNYFINKAKQIRIEQQKLGPSGYINEQYSLITQTTQQDNDRQEQEHLQREIQHFVRAAAQSAGQNSSRTEVKEVNELWEGKQPYYYDKEQKQEYVKQEKDCDQRISNVMYQKSKQLWDELQFYWFQVNKSLHPRYRKDQLNTMSSVEQQQQQQLQQAAMVAAHQQQRNAAPGVDPSVMHHQQVAGMQGMGPNGSVMMQQRPPPQQAPGQMNVAQASGQPSQMGQASFAHQGQYPIGVNPVAGQQMAPNAVMMGSSGQQAMQYGQATQQGRIPSQGQATISTGQPAGAVVGSQSRRQQYQHANSAASGGGSTYLMPQGNAQGAAPSQSQQQMVPHEVHPQAHHSQQPANMVMMSQGGSQQRAAPSGHPQQAVSNQAPPNINSQQVPAVGPSTATATAVPSQEPGGQNGAAKPPTR